LAPALWLAVDSQGITAGCEEPERDWGGKQGRPTAGEALHQSQQPLERGCEGRLASGTVKTPNGAENKRALQILLCFMSSTHVPAAYKFYWEDRLHLTIPSDIFF